MDALDRLIQSKIDAGRPPETIFIAGFSQGVRYPFSRRCNLQVVWAVPLLSRAGFLSQQSAMRAPWHNCRSFLVMVLSIL